jgi:hypothetical protein
MICVPNDNKKNRKGMSQTTFLALNLSIEEKTLLLFKIRL